MATINFHVVDLYQFDRVTDFSQAADGGIWGVIHKATTGATGRDKQYADRRKQAKSTGLLWGAYHWGTSARVRDQVDNFMKTADPDDETLVALDYESDRRHQMTLDQAREFLSALDEMLGRKAVLYSGHLIKEQLGGRKDAFFGSHRLWLAQYGERPSVQRSWDQCWLWQYTDNRKGLNPNRVVGIPGNAEGDLDCNSYGGSQDDLKKEWAS